jgi:hypothetical protein
MKGFKKAQNQSERVSFIGTLYFRINIYNKMFLEELIAYFPLVRHGPHRKQKTGGYKVTQTARRSHKLPNKN